MGDRRRGIGNARGRRLRGVEPAVRDAGRPRREREGVRAAREVAGRRRGGGPRANGLCRARAEHNHKRTFLLELSSERTHHTVCTAGSVQLGRLQPGHNQPRRTTAGREESRCACPPSRFLPPRRGRARAGFFRDATARVPRARSAPRALGSRDFRAIGTRRRMRERSPPRRSFASIPPAPAGEAPGTTPEGSSARRDPRAAPYPAPPPARTAPLASEISPPADAARARDAAFALVRSTIAPRSLARARVALAARPRPAHHAEGTPFSPDPSPPSLTPLSSLPPLLSLPTPRPPPPGPTRKIPWTTGPTSRRRASPSARSLSPRTTRASAAWRRTPPARRTAPDSTSTCGGVSTSASPRTSSRRPSERDEGGTRGEHHL